MSHSLRIFFLFILCGSFWSCTTPGLYNAVPSSSFSQYRKILVISALGDRISYHSQGMISGDRTDIDVTDLKIDNEIAKRTASVASDLFKVEVSEVSALDFPKLYNLHNGRAAPGNSGVDFDAVKPELKRMVALFGADAIILVFKGTQGLPGGHQYWVQGPSVSKMHGYCGLFSVAMIAIVGKESLEPIAANYVAPPYEEGKISLPRPIELPESFCDQQLKLLSSEQRLALRAASLQLFSRSILRASMERLTSK